MSSTGEVYLGLYGDDFEPNEVIPDLQPLESEERGSVEKMFRFRELLLGSFHFRENEDDNDVYEMSTRLVSVLAPYAEIIVKAKEVFGFTLCSPSYFG